MFFGDTVYNIGSHLPFFYFTYLLTERAL